MLSSHAKGAIQEAYSEFLSNRKLKPRTGQKQMIAAIAKTMGAIQVDGDGNRTGGSHICVVEAGTGTGKTLAYLLSTIPLAEDLDKKIIISTATVALQEQLIGKDIPDVAKYSGLDFRYALAKGRGRYLCVHKLDQEMKDQRMQDASMDMFGGADATDDQKGLFQRFLDEFLTGRWDGDRDNWPETIEYEDWSMVTATHRECSNRRCPHFNACPFFNARKALEDADVIVANHDLVMADISLGGGAILPEPGNSLYVFDEGHHLPDKAISHFAGQVKLNQEENLLKQVSKAVDTLGKQCGTPMGLLQIVTQLPEKIGEIHSQLGFVRHIILDYLGDQAEQEGITTHRFRMGVVPPNLVELAGELNKTHNSLYQYIDKIVESLKASLNKDDGEYKQSDAERWFPVMGMLLARLENAGLLWLSFAQQDHPENVPVARWLDRIITEYEDDIALYSSPILAAELLAKNLWSRCHGAVVTSATLTALGRFDRLRMKAGIAKDNYFEIIQSPFDYPNLGELVVPADAVEPSHGDDYTQAITNLLETHLDETQSTLVLFTSRRVMNDVKFQLPFDVSDHVMTQDEFSKQEVLKQHREKIENNLPSYLFGLASFAEGIDLPGDLLQHVIIVRLPFSVPDDPVDATLAEWLESKGRNPFMEISVPDASVRLIQAVGRLIRTEQDTGKITVLDKRIVSKRYGSLLLDGLPPFRRNLSVR
ncbi:ATP-dependent DNA helicase DinG [Bermanella sp. R86510]|uniref:ATP-dependent DNA helicase DinG n=1 Tax=unclassified Bermanella TaxID=2627862 RepID=UPI0037C508A3